MLDPKVLATMDFDLFYKLFVLLDLSIYKLYFLELNEVPLNYLFSDFLVVDKVFTVYA